MNEKEYNIKQQELSKMKKVLIDKEKFLNSYIKKWNNLIKLKEKEYNKKNILFNNNEDQYEANRMTIVNNNNYLMKEDDLNNKEDLLIQKEKELLIKEKQLKEREKKIKNEKVKLNNRENELDEKIKEIDEKFIIMKNQDYLINFKKEEDKNDSNLEDIDDKELAKIQEELEEEMNLEENNNNKNEIHNKEKKDSNLNNIYINTKKSTLAKSLNINSSRSPKNNSKISNRNTEQKLNRNLTINTNLDNNKNNNNIHDGRKTINVNLIRAKTLNFSNSPKNFLNSSPNNNNLKNRISLNPSVNQTQTKINKNLPSLGLERVEGPMNLNAILQCFAHIPELAEGILELGYNKFFKDKKNIKLSRNFATIVNNIFFPNKFYNNTRKYSPELFVETFLTLYPQENPKSYLSTLKTVNYILETFHDELNIKKNIIDDIKNDNLEEKDEIDKSNEEKVLVEFLTKLTKNNSSLISKFFFGLTKSKCVCNECGNMTYSFDSYSYLYFNLLKIKKYMLNNKFRNNNSICLSLYDCFDYYQRPFNLSNSIKEMQKSFCVKFNVNEKNGKIFCNKCQEEKNGTLYKSIYSAHTILPFILERGNDDNYFIEELKFPDELNLENYVEYNKSIKKYYLCGVVSNLGRNNTFGNFCAYCRMIHNGKWFCYKNEYVSYCAKEDVHHTGVPYMLFYHKI